MKILKLVDINILCDIARKKGFFQIFGSKFFFNFINAKMILNQNK
jgi:hypothetical protein